MRCPVPECVPNSDIKFTSLTEGAIVTYTCEALYWLEKGDAQLTCGSNFKWIGQIPVCSSKMTFSDSI